LPPENLRINGQPYAIGASAERHGVQVQWTGAACYTRDDYGIFAAAALARLYERSMEILVFGSYPPGDLKLRDDLMKAVIGDWHVEQGSHERHFKLEPLSLNGNLIIHLSRSSILGLFMTLVVDRFLFDPRRRILITIGFLSSYTTFSSYADWQQCIGRCGYSGRHVPGTVDIIYGRLSNGS
jgi:hypothetical protein